MNIIYELNYVILEKRKLQLFNSLMKQKINMIISNHIMYCSTTNEVIKSSR